MKEDPRHIHISEYSYPLPDERIAKFPLPTRDQSKLLIYRRGEVSEDVFTSLPEYLPQGSLMIFNNTKVIQARLHFRKETGALIEVFCLEPIQPNDYVLNFQQTAHAAWLCMIGNLKKWKDRQLKREMTIRKAIILIEYNRSDRRKFLLKQSNGSVRRTIVSHADLDPLPFRIPDDGRKKSTKHITPVPI